MNIRELQKKMENVRKRLDPEVIEREKKIEKRKGIAKGVAIGSLVAGMTALFLSPDSGKNNRKKAKEELEKAKELLEENIIEGKEKLSKVYDIQKETIESKKNILKEKLNLNHDMNSIENEDYMDIIEDIHGDMNIIDEMDIDELEKELAE